MASSQNTYIFLLWVSIYKYKDIYVHIYIPYINAYSFIWILEKFSFKLFKTGIKQGVFCMTSFFIQMETILMNGCESSVTLRGSNFAWFTIDEVQIL